MSTLTETPQELYVSCRTPGCVGFSQRAVPGVARTSSMSYLELGGDLGGQEERSVTHYSVVNPEDAEGGCDHCGTALLVTEQRRPEYPTLTRQEILENIQGADTHVQARIDQAVQIDRLERQVAELTAAQAAPKGAKDGPRPVKAIPAE